MRGAELLLGRTAEAAVPTWVWRDGEQYRWYRKTRAKTKSKAAGEGARSAQARAEAADRSVGFTRAQEKAAPFLGPPIQKRQKAGSSGNCMHGTVPLPERLNVIGQELGKSESSLRLF
jgi:hypothetical protein